MRTIQVSTDVYAAIWAQRKEGEESEDEILRRKLGVPKAILALAVHEGRVGFSDPKHGFEVPEGFEIFRTYKGTEYRARAADGNWLLLSTGDMYRSLNQLSQAVAEGPENAWNNWHYLDKAGKRQLLHKLRNKEPQPRSRV